MDFKVNKKKGESKDSPLRYVYFFLLLVFRGHIAFDIEAYHFGFCVGTQGNRLFEVSRIFTCSVVSYFDCTFLSRLDRFFGIFGHCASARRYRLMNY